jgi:hypothetical protein
LLAQLTGSAAVLFRGCPAREPRRASGLNPCSHNP